MSTPTRKTKIFISYSRKNIAFVRKLTAALNAAGIETWVDWEGIPPSADWMEEIKSAIRGADAFVFVISPNSLASKVCAAELELSLKDSKKLVPVLYGEPSAGAKMHPRLRSTNWVNIRPKQDDFKSGIAKIVQSLQTDLEWVQRHTRLLQRANEWTEKKRNSSYLLHGSELEESERWLSAGAAEEEERNVLPLQVDYITASRKAATARLRGLIAGIAVAFMLSLILGMVALQQKAIAEHNAVVAVNSRSTAIANAEARVTQQFIAEENMRRAENSERVAQVQRNAALAQLYQSQADELDTSTLLGIEASAQLAGADAEDILRHNLSLLAIPLKQMSVGAEINKIQRNRDRTKFVTADAGGQACVWNMADGANIFCTQQSGSLNDAVFTRDGKFLVTASDQGEVIFWDADTGAQKKILTYPNQIIWDLNVNPNGMWIGVGRSGGFSLLDVNELSDVFFYSTTSDVRKMDFDPAGELLAFARANGSISLWRIAFDDTSGILPVLNHTREAVDVTYSPDGGWIVSAGTDSMARAISMSDRSTYAIAHGDWVQYVSFGPDDSWFVTVSDDGYVRVIDTLDENGRVVMRERLRLEHDNYVTRVRVSSDGQWLASTGYDRTARIWDSFSGAELMRLPLEGIGSAIEFNADATRLIVGDRDGNITLWDVSRLHARAQLVKFPEFLREAHFSPDGQWLVANTDDSKVSLIPAQLLGAVDDQRRELPGIEGLTSRLAVSNDSRWIAVVQYDNRKPLYNVLLIPADGTSAPVIMDERPVSAIAFTPDNTRLITAGHEDRAIIVWDIATREIVDRFEADGVVAALAVSPDGKYLVAGIEQNNHTLVWDLSTHKLAAQLGQFGAITAVQFSRDGRLLATGSAESTVQLWDMTADFRPAATFRVDGGVSSLAFDPTATYLAAGDSVGVAFLFDVARGEELARLRHFNEAQSVSFSPDGTRLAVVSQKGINLWDVGAIPQTPRSSLINAACSSLFRNFTPSEWRNLFAEKPYQLICPPLLTAGED